MNQSDDFLRDRVRSGVAGPPPAPSERSDPTAVVPRHQMAPPGASRPAPPDQPAPSQPFPSQPVPQQPAPSQPFPSQPVPQQPAPSQPHHVPWPHHEFNPAVHRPSRPQPVRGWRRLVLAATFGLVNLGPSTTERQESEYTSTIRAPLRGSYKVGVLGKGGVGKTTVAASVGSVFAQLRRNDRVVAVDADTAFGRLGSRIDPQATSSYWDLATDQNLQSFADISARVGANDAGLYVLTGEPAAGRGRVLDPALYREAALRLDRHFTISIIDCGSTMDAPVTREALRDLDALIVVSSPWADGAAAAAKTMQWLADHGQIDLLARTVVVLNDSDGHADKRTRATLAEQFSRYGQAVIEVPFDPHLRPGGVIDVAGEMASRTRLKFLQITAIVAYHFAARHRR